MKTNKTDTPLLESVDQASKITNKNSNGTKKKSLATSISKKSSKPLKTQINGKKKLKKTPKDSKSVEVEQKPPETDNVDNVDDKTDKEEVKDQLTPKQELFCQLYAIHIDYLWNGTQAYAEAYWYNLSDIKQNKICQASASRMLRNVKVLERLRKLQDDFLSDEMIDKELAFVALQRADLWSKMRAISEYNRLKWRINNLVELSAWEELLNKFRISFDGKTKDIVGWG